MSPADVAQMAVIALAWSGGWIAGKIAVSAVPPLAMSAVRFALASVVLAALARAAGATIPWRRWPTLVALGATGFFGYNALVFVGLVYAPATDGGLIVPTFSPVLAAVLAVPLADERLTRAKVAGLACSSLGVVLVVAGGAGIAEGSGARLAGDLLILGGAACFAVYAVLGRSALREGTPLGVTAASTVIGFALLALAALFEGGLARVGQWPLEVWLAIAFLALVSTVLGFVLFYRLVARLGAARAATTPYLVPVMTLALAALLLGERPTLLQLAGGALTLVGMRVAEVPSGEGAWLRRFAGV